MTVPAKPPRITRPPRQAQMPPRNKPAELPYKVICISIYNEDLEAIDLKVAALKARGFRKANRSLVIRLAMKAFEPGSIEIPEVQ